MSSAGDISLHKRMEDVEVEEIDVEVDEGEDDQEYDNAASEGSTLEQRNQHDKKTHHRSDKQAGRRRKSHNRHKHHDNRKRPSKGTFSGKGTFFKPNQGSCGKWNTANDKIVALSKDIYQGGSHCFKRVKVCHGARCADATVADLCPGCKPTSLDMTPSLFKQLASLEAGVIDIKWSFV